MTIPRATFDEVGDVALQFPFHRGLVETLKREIPPYARTFVPALRTWTISSPYAELALQLMQDWFHDVQVDRPAGDRSANVNEAAQPFAVLHLLPSAPPELVDAAYRTLAQLAHAERDGSQTAMRELNTARDALRGSGS